MAHNKLFNTNIETVVIFMVTREKQYQPFVVTGNEYKKYQRMWHQRLETFYNTDTAK